MSDLESAFHKRWRGLVEPVEGLVVSVPVLVAAECMHRQGPELQEKLRDECDAAKGWRVRSLESFFANILGFAEGVFVPDPEGVSVYLPEGSETVAASYALKSRAADAPYVMLVWDVPDVELDRPDSREGKWAYPPKDKFDRLLRHARVPIGLLTNRREFRLFYAPHDESTGILTFRVADMVQTMGHEVLDAFVMLLSSHRFFAVAKDRQLPALLAKSRLHQANVTTALASQVFEALAILLRGFEAASLRDGDSRLREAVAEGKAYPALLTVLLRLVFLLYAEDLSLLPVGHPHYAEHLSILSLHARLQADAASFPDTMSRRFGAWPRLLALFRAVYFGIRHADLTIPLRRGVLFDPAEYPFLEGWGPAGGAPTQEADRAAVRIPSIDDETVFHVLDRLIVLEGERLSYRALDVEQIGSVYEALMGYAVDRTDGDSVCTRPHGVWVSASELLALPSKERVRHLENEPGCLKREVAKIAPALASATTEEAVLDAIAPLGRARIPTAHSSQLVLQPGKERRRTSSHYTPRALSEPIVRRTLEPLLQTMGENPPSERILSLKICDPAMGSGAFLVGACRFLGAALEQAWAHEGRTGDIAREHGSVPLFAKRLVAQRCLYGVDKNPLAVGLAKLSLWLETLAKDEPFTFLDHALKHGDSLVGLSLDQARAFHWAPEEQVELATREIELALTDGVRARQEILELAKGEDALHEYADQKQRLLFDADDALSRVRLLADLVVGAFFAHEKPKDRESERVRRLDKAVAWLRDGGAPPEELRAMQRESRAKVPAFHWMMEFPEVFHAERPDPLDGGRVNRAAMMDAFVGNPPFAGKNEITAANGASYLPWLQTLHAGAHGNADLSAHFFRRASTLLGKHGTIGFIATNTIAQGDTRTTGLRHLVTVENSTIYDATRSTRWPGEAKVSVSVVHVAKGSVAKMEVERQLGGVKVDNINSRLRAKPERPDAVILRANANRSFQGAIVLGMGFILTPDERSELIAKDKLNTQRIFPYLGGEEVNSRPDQKFERYVISFGQMSLEEAEAWPDLIDIIREKVKPERDRLANNPDGRRRKEFWWQFGRLTPALDAAVVPLKQCLVSSVVSKYVLFSFLPTNWTFSANLHVFAMDDFASFAVLQSGIHDAWARAHASTLETRTKYVLTDCFETFPFLDPLGDAVERIGSQLYEARAAYMRKHQCGLTETYNRMKDIQDHDPEVQELRRLSEETDRAVLAAYGWASIDVPAFEAQDDDPIRQRFEDEVLDLLFALNAERAENERVLGSAASGATAKPKRPSASERGKKKVEDQGDLPGVK